MEKIRRTLLSRRCLISLVVLTIVSGSITAYILLSSPVINNTERFQIIHDFGDYFSDDIEVTYYGSFLVAAADGLIEVTSDSNVSSISSFHNLSIRDIVIETNRDRNSNGVIAYIASNLGISVFYAWGERRQDLNLSVDAERGIGFNPHRLALSPSGQFLYIFDSINGVYSVDLDHSFYFADQRFIPELLNESTQSWPFDYGSPMNGLQLTHMSGTNEGIILGGESGLFYFDKTNEVWSNTTFTHQTTTLEVECLSYMPSDRTIFVGIYGGIESYQLVSNNIVSIGEIALPEHEWDAIYAIEYDLYFNRLYAGSPDGLYVFFLNNGTSRFYSQEEAQWTGFSVYSIGTIQHQPSSIYFSTLSECYILDLSVYDEVVPSNNDWVQELYPILTLITAVTGVILTAFSVNIRRQSLEVQKESIRASSHEAEQEITSDQGIPVSGKVDSPVKMKSKPAVVTTDSDKEESVKVIAPPIQCIKNLIEVVKEARLFLFGRKIKSSFGWEQQHRKIESRIIGLYQQCGHWVPNLGDFIKLFRKSMIFDKQQLDSVIKSADQIVEHLNENIDNLLEK